MSRFLLWGGSRRTPTRSCVLEDWEGAVAGAGAGAGAGGGDAAGGSRQSVVEVAEEGEEEEVGAEEVEVGEAAGQAEGRTAAMLPEAEEGSGRKEAGEAGEHEGEAAGEAAGEAVGEACAPWWLKWSEQREVFWPWGERAGALAGPQERAGCSWVWWGGAWVRLEGEAEEEAAGWCWAGWGPVSSEGPSGSDPPRPGLCRPGRWWPGGGRRGSASPWAPRRGSAAATASGQSEENETESCFT